MQRIGIFSGTFDPFHIGHLEACLVSKGALELDEVLIMVEKKPKQKSTVTDYKHRRKIIELSIADFPFIKIFNSANDNITFDNTVHLLEKEFPASRFCILVGSDILPEMQKWPGFDEWLANSSIAVILRDNKEQKAIQELIKGINKSQPKSQISLLPAVWSPVSSSSVKKDIKETKHSDLMHRSALEYIKKHRLYS